MSSSEIITRETAVCRQVGIQVLRIHGDAGIEVVLERGAVLRKGLVPRPDRWIPKHEFDELVALKIRTLRQEVEAASEVIGVAAEDSQPLNDGSGKHRVHVDLAPVMPVCCRARVIDAFTACYREGIEVVITPEPENRRLFVRLKRSGKVWGCAVNELMLHGVGEADATLAGAIERGLAAFRQSGPERSETD